MGRQGGIEAFTMYRRQPLQFRSQSGERVYTYNFHLTNHGQDMPTISIYLVYEQTSWRTDGRVAAVIDSQMQTIPIVFIDGLRIMWSTNPRFNMTVFGESYFKITQERAFLAQT